MTKDEALRLALEALEKISRTQYHIETPPIESLEEKMRRIADKAINTVKAALKAKNEPVMCGACNGSGHMVRDPDIGTDQECFACEGSGVFEDTTPPQRKPLTDEEIKSLDYSGTRIEFVRAIEAAHGIKGEA
jgi:hypothetical protein